MDRWTQMQLFAQVVELGSLSKAAERIGLSNAAASRHLQALEERLGTRLIERTTRRQWVTEAGQAFHQRCTAVLADLAIAELEANQASAVPTGCLRVTASVSFSMLHIAPALPEFIQRYPSLSIDIVSTNRYHDFIEAGIDVAIRTKEYETDSGITVRRLAETRRVLAASPGYFATHPQPLHPQQLQGHQFLVYQLANDPLALNFTRGSDNVSIPIKATLSANEGQVLRAAALAGQGILVQPMYIVHEDIVAGRLIPVLTDWSLPRLTINLAYQSRRHQPAKIRVFIDFFLARFARLELERKWTVL
jgi:DNA-binding transcriptional LysR family regulator